MSYLFLQAKIKKNLTCQEYLCYISIGTDIDFIQLNILNPYFSNFNHKPFRNIRFAKLVSLFRNTWI